MLLHLAKILEISGFILATIFGGILLNREMFGKINRKLDSSLKKFRRNLEIEFNRIFKYSEFLTTNEFTKNIIGATVLRGISIILIIIGWQINNMWLIWIGLIIALPYVLLGILLVLFRIKSRLGMRRMWFYPVLLCWSLLLSFVIAPIALFIYILVLYTILLIWFSVALVAREDSLKKGMIITGSIAVIVGLIIETVVTW